MPVEPSELLHRAGLQVTAQRLAVLQVVRSRPHSTANEVAAAVRDQIGAISRQSVYDTLTALTDHTIIRRIQPAGSPARFEGRVGDNHHHLICKRCDRLVDVDCAVAYTPCLTPAQDWEFDVHEAEVIYWGICPDCKDADS